MRNLSGALVLSILPVAALAGDDAAVTREIGETGFTYELFEESVAHVDLETCPDGFDDETQFCRLTLAEEQANVFVFTLEGTQPLVAIRSYPLTGQGLPF